MAGKKSTDSKQEEPQETDEEQVFFSDDNEDHSHSSETVTWKASEYIHHEKSMSWYFGLVGAAILVGVVLYFVNDSPTSIGSISSYLVLITMTIATMVYANRKPETLTYTLSDESLKIADKEYFLDDFRSFSMISDGGVISVQLAPLKRFMPPVSLYYDPKDEVAIINILANILPHEETELDLIDRLIRRVRF